MTNMFVASLESRVATDGCKPDGCTPVLFHEVSGTKKLVIKRNTNSALSGNRDMADSGWPSQVDECRRVTVQDKVDGCSPLVRESFARELCRSLQVSSRSPRSLS